MRYDEATREIRHSLRIDATKDEYLAARRKYGRTVTLHMPTGELVGNLAGYAWAWKLQGRLMGPFSITAKDRLNAQGLEGKFTVTMPLFDAILASIQADPHRTMISENGG